MTQQGDAARVMARIEELGMLSEEQGCLTRRFGSPAMRQANDLVAGWMRAAGLEVIEDQIGNVRGRYRGAPGATRTLLLGSHIDTVRDAGKYDGPLGVLIALAAVEQLQAQGQRLPFAIEVLAFADEEGLRFHSTYLGSKVVAGTFDPTTLALTDAEGLTLADVIRSFGGDPHGLAAARRPTDDLLGYCEVHIEQGPVLEARGLPVGIVSAIAGQNRSALRFVGQAGHAGTVPMDLRHDALCAAAEFVVAVERHARANTGVVATVGQLRVAPGASNVIPGAVDLSLDVRHAEDQQRVAADAAIHEAAEAICAARGVGLEWQTLQAGQSVPCDPELQGLLGTAITECGYPVLALPSGAGHDAAALAAITPVAMLFVRCAGGISHNPAESVQTDDVAVALRVLGHVLRQLAVREEAR